MDSHRLLLGLGSNADPTHNMQTAREWLCQLFGHVIFSRFLWTEPIGQVSPPYLNALAYTRTTFSYDEVDSLLKDMEQRLGRCRDGKSAHRITIDMDILQYDDTKYHLKDWERDYVTRLTEDLHDVLCD